MIKFRYKDSNDDKMIELAFKKDKTDDWKQWLQETPESNFVDHSVKQLSY